MKILKYLFGGDTNKPQKKTKGWRDTYFASKSMRQIVIEVQSPIWMPSRFKNLVLPFDKYHTILQNPTSTGFVKMASELTPILLMRADNLSDDLKSSVLDIAFSFCRTQLGGILALFVVPRTGEANGHLEMVYGLDNEETINRIKEGWRNGYLDLVLADKSDSMAVPQAKYDFRLPLTPDCVSALDEALNHLLNHHQQILPQKRDYQAASQVVWDLMPMGKSPIFPESEGQPNEEIKKQAAEAMARARKQLEDLKLITRQKYINFKTEGIEDQSYHALNLELENIRQGQSGVDTKYNILYSKIGVFDDFKNGVSNKEHLDLINRCKEDLTWISTKYGGLTSVDKDENFSRDYQRIVNRAQATVDYIDKYIAQFSNEEQDDQSNSLSLVIKCLMILTTYTKIIEDDLNRS